MRKNCDNAKTFKKGEYYFLKEDFNIKKIKLILIVDAKFE